jgi:Zn-dependent protease
MDELNIIQRIAVMALPLIFAVILHEVAHGWIANKLGDHTARDMGRLTLNPLPHIDIIGTIILPLICFFFLKGIIFGYAKPVPINPYNFKNPKRDMALSSLAGPGINLAMALLFAFLLRMVIPLVKDTVPAQAVEWIVAPIELMLIYGVFINVILAVLNMVPIPPLDGSRVLYWVLPNKLAAAYYRLEPFGMIILMVLMMLGVLWDIIRPIIEPVLSLLLGQSVL